MSHQLILAKQSFTLESVWMEGYAHGESEAHHKIRCPYPDGSKEEAYWNEGWDTGFYAELPLYPDYRIELSSLPSLVVPAQERQFGRVEKFIYSVSLAVGAVVACALLAA